MSSMVSLMGGTGIIVAGVGGGVPAVRSAPPSVAAGAGVPSFALVSPGAYSGRAGRSVWFDVVCAFCFFFCGFPCWGRAKGPFYLGSANSCWVVAARAREGVTGQARWYVGVEVVRGWAVRLGPLRCRESWMR